MAMRYKKIEFFERNIERILMNLIKHTLHALAVTVLAISGFATSANAAPTGIGFGVTAWEPIGITGKFWMGAQAIDLTAGWSPQNMYILSGDYLRHFEGMMGQKMLLPYIGGGAVLFGSTDDARKDGTWFADDHTDDLGIGVHIPVGIEWQMESVPVGVSVQVAPGLGFIPKSFTFLNAGIAARYYF